MSTQIRTERRNALSKAIFVAVQVALGLLKLPAQVILFSLFRASRPRKELSFAQSLFVVIVRRAITVMSECRVYPQVAHHNAHIDTSRLKRSVLVRVPPIESSRITGDLAAAASKAHVRAVPINAYMFFGKRARYDPMARVQSRKSEDRLILALHGGAYVIGSAHESNNSTTAPQLVDQLPSNIEVLSLEYRLAEENPFPSAVLDHLSAYAWAIEGLHYSPEQIILSGDSAGGNIVFALMEYLQRSKALPFPAALHIVSPGVDRTFSHRANHALAVAGKEPSQRADVLTPELLRWSSESYLGYGKHSRSLLSGPYVSMGSKVNLARPDALANWPPTFFSVGEFETYRQEQTVMFNTLRDRNAHPDRCVLQVIRGGLHDATVLPGNLFEPATSRARKEMAEWLKSV